jgi:DNA-binding response OmpR family regulator
MRGADRLMPPPWLLRPEDDAAPSGAAVGSGAAGGVRLKGLRVFIAEDEFLVAVMLEQDLRSSGCTVVGPFTSLALALQASRREEFDVAILDVNMNGEMVYPLADELLARGTPFLFLTGYGTANLPERHRKAPRLSKPYDLDLLMKEMARVRSEGKPRKN